MIPCDQGALMRLIAVLFCSLIFIGCNDRPNITGLWQIDINLQNKTLPLILEIKQNESILDGTIFNSNEKIKLEGTIKDNEFELIFTQSYAKFVGELKGDKLTGFWIRTNKDDYKVSLKGHKTAKKSLFSKFEKKNNLLNMSGNWKVQLDENKFGLGHFTQKGSRINGSILTETGDYRFLDGFIENNKAYLYGFDGVFSFIIEFTVKSEEFIATMYSGKSYNKEISGIKDDNYKLTDPYLMTASLQEAPLDFKMNDIDGKLIDLNSAELKNKAKIIQIFGSWCPNCIDETNYFLKWRKENLAKLNQIEFIAVSFENTKTKKQALKNLKKLRFKMGIDYPIILADFDKSKKVEDFFPIDKNRAFPTTLYLNKNNQIRKVHTGFSGQATGVFFDNFKVKFNESINKLIEEI